MPRYLPKIFVCFREGYSWQKFLNDLIAGITVGIVALPLAMAFGIASIPDNVAHEAGIPPPAMGLYTAVVAGFLISALGGSRVQIGGPTGAFIVIVYGIAAKHGYAGLMAATFMAGMIVILMGLARFGAMIKFIPYPVTTGFTSGIALIIFSSQIKDFFGLHMGAVPPDFAHKWLAYAQAYATVHWITFAVAAGSLAVMVALRRVAPRIPGAMIAVVLASLLVWWFKWPVETIGEKFGEIPRALPKPHFPNLSFSLMRSLIPEATTIALLAAIESLLSAVVADGMIGGRHKADCELVAQGFANIGSVIFGGIPATGAIARTATNIKSGGRTPVAGIIHAVTLLLIMAVLAPLAGRIPLATLSAVLVLTAWNMSELDHFRALFRAPRGDVIVLLTTFGLTVFADLTLAVGVGMVLASLLFMKRMADVSNVSAVTREFSDDDIEDPESAALGKLDLPSAIQLYEINGPFFFGVADRLKDVLGVIAKPPKVFILHIRKVPTIDATGLHALEEFYEKCKRHGTVLILSGVHAQPLSAFERVGFDRTIGPLNMCTKLTDALIRAKEILQANTA